MNGKTQLRSAKIRKKEQTKVITDITECANLNYKHYRTCKCNDLHYSFKAQIEGHCNDVYCVLKARIEGRSGVFVWPGRPKESI